MRALLPGILGLAVTACGSSSSTPTILEPATLSDAGAGEGADAGTKDGAGRALSATGMTSAEVTIGGVVRTLERAQFGVTTKDDTLYVEAHEGGATACPETVTPKRTLIVSGVPRGAAGATFTIADGVSVALIDFAGDQIATNPPNAKATSATVTIVALDGQSSVEVEVDATFAKGSAKGRVYATYCAAMSE